MIRDDDFAIENVKQWEDRTSELRNLLSPLRGHPNVRRWTDLGLICSNLNRVASTGDLNYMYSPPGGGTCLEYVARSAEDECLELHAGSKVHIVHPTRLEFHIFGDDRPELSCFRLEFEGIEETGIDNDEIEDNRETLCEKRPGSRNYIEPWHYHDHRGELPSGARIVWRWTEDGVFLVVPKGGDYNTVTEHSDGRHSDMNSREFRRYIEERFQESESD